MNRSAQHTLRGRAKSALAALLCALPLAGGVTPLAAAVRVITGPTPIPGGGARAAGDLTVVNDRLAFALAVESPVPYGVPRGALVDLAPVSAGVIQRDRVVFADFIPDNWSAWPNTYHRVEVLERGPQRVRIRSVRDFGQATVSTEYLLEDGSDQIGITTVLTNNGATALKDLLSGLTLWPGSGYRLNVPGYAALTDGAAPAPLARRMTAYDSDWSITLHAPYFDHIGSGSRDLLLRHTLAPHASRTFQGWLQVGTRGDLAPVVAAQIAHEHLPAGTVHGTVTDRDGHPLAQPVLVVEKNGSTWAWTLGDSSGYRLTLPQGDYQLYATGRGYSRSAARRVSVHADSREQLDFGALQSAGRIDFQVVDAQSARPLDARIAIVGGDVPAVGFLGGSVFFTDLVHRGQLDTALAPGHYEFSVSHGGGFLGPEARVSATVTPGGTQTLRVTLHLLFDPAARHWYSADLHHHADQAEAVTPPADLARSQLAAGLDVLTVSDHDSTVNHAPLARIAAARGVAFLPGIEISPSWGHFNAWAIRQGEPLTIDPGTATAAQIIAEARRMGAAVVQVNHPFIPFGYFTSVAAGVAPGGFVPGFDLVEINATAPADDTRVLQWLWRAWNEGHPYYLSAGTDTHDVWNDLSGRVRVYAHVGQAPDAQSYAAALKAGHAYVSFGPLIYPSVPFGGRLRVARGAPFALDFEFQSVPGLKEVQLVGNAGVLQTRQFAGQPQRARTHFSLSTGSSCWYALVVSDTAGHKAYTNPIWVDTITP
ncbi:MAG: CehA/McbA family metallohydrolase [Proteobacteria bacterium]|nr:CehA/McbA family metallohydrolase [Pseudomonadota bacterium]